jgi:hypothetical protein
MDEIAGIVRQLEQQRSAIERAIAALSEVQGSGSSARGVAGAPKRRLSAAGRRRIAEGARRRWAAVKAAKKKARG